MRLKTIFITSFNSFISRNILSTDVLGKLRQEFNLRIVIFCPDYKVDYFRKEFGSSNVIIEGIREGIFSPQDIFFSYLSRSLIATKTLAIHRKEIFLRSKKLLPFLFSYFLTLIGWLPLIKKLVRFCDFFTISKNKFRAYLDKYRPNLVFATDVFHINDVHFLAEARYRKIPAIGMVRSWDNITNKGLFRIRPDKLIVHNEVVKDEAIRYEDIKSRDIFVSGLPQVDCYVNQSRSPREEFFRRTGLDPGKKTVFIAPSGERFYKDDWQLLEILKKEFLNLQFIVRIPPNDMVDLSKFKPSKKFFIEHPGISFKKGFYRDRELSVSDSQNLADELFYSDLVINYSSTIIIEASFFDKPVINIAFDGWETRSYLNSVRRLIDFTHTHKLLKTDCCKIAYNKEDLIEFMNLYLEHPEIDREGREKAVRQQLWKRDGKSGQRIADFILKHL